MCLNQLSSSKVGHNIAVSSNGTITNITSTLPGIQRKFDLSTFKEISLSDDDK